MSVSATEKSIVTLIAKELTSDGNVRAIDNLRALRRNFAVETGDIDTGAGLSILLKLGLVYKIEHLHDYNVPDYAITQRGMLVYEQLKFENNI